MKKLRVSSLFLTLILLFSVVPTAVAESPLLPKIREYVGFTDTKGAWCDAAVKTCYEAGLLEGTSSSTFSANKQLTYDQIFFIAARLHSRLTGGTGAFPAPKKGRVWCQSAYDYLMLHVRQMGDMTLTQPTEADFWSQLCERRFFADVLWATLTSASVTLPKINELDFIPDGGGTPDEAAFSLYRAGIIKGTNAYGFFDGGGILTRGECAVMLARVLDPTQRLTFTLEGFPGLCEVLGVPPETVLFRVEDTDLTADQCSYLLATGITTTSSGSSDLSWSEAYAQERLRNMFAVVSLARQRGISLSGEELAKIKESATSKVELGVSREDWLSFSRYQALGFKVKEFYAKEYGADSNAHGIVPAFSEAVKKTAVDIVLKPTAAYEAIDLAAFQKALLSSGFFALHYAAPSEL